MTTIPLTVLPRAVPIQSARAPQENIPSTKAERDAIVRAVRRFLESEVLVPPLPFEELRRRTEAVALAEGIDSRYRDFTAVVLNNELWRETLASVPYERRLLLLPKCLRVESHCPAPFDEFGLLCKKCGMCSIQDLQDAAERLGYAVLVAEGSPIVMALIETGKIDAIVGVSCLSVLERAFPYMEAAAIPGIALPLLQDDCKDTTVDLDWVWDIIHLTSDDRTRRMDLGALREEVDAWFSRERLEDVMGKPVSRTEEIALDWVARAGKRWRPFLTVAVHQALRSEPGAAIPEDLRKVAAAVECFHKASLIHDDIEDQDTIRYGERTLHEEHGIPVALNVGDWLIGEGYRLIAECEAPADARAAMLLVASRGHRTLCLGQGAELCWGRSPSPLSSVQVLEIFRQKTAPAFEVALRLGAIYAGVDESVRDVLTRYSESLGIAYQIRDDLDDLAEAPGLNDIAALRPTLPLALCHERAKGEEKELLRSLWSRQAAGDPGKVRAILDSLGVPARVRELLEAYKEEAIRSLWDLANPNLKGLLRRVVGKIFNDTEIKGWCNEFEARSAADRATGAQSAP
ncbi:MAG TPA: polyprenyl synthetase family protein [Planctomycetota bacterium]|nr:polyprenyl synthetase family protein [Planctomycetota bacterium]